MICGFLAIFVCPVFAAVRTGSWIRQSDQVCFSAQERQNTELFTSKVGGVIGGVRFVHLNGGVSCCGDGPPTDFGCVDHRIIPGGNGVFTVLVSESKNNVMYPSFMTEGVTSFVNYQSNTRFDWYIMPRIDDGILTLLEPLYSVSRGEAFRVQYTEVFNDASLQDNSGTSCVAVDFLVLSCSDPWHLPSENCTHPSVAEHSAGAKVIMQ
uniref:Uncharacterized protein n=1 Tax=Noctiluca scintillans TaxID=2966 RepID=A0A7S1A6P3_NOCSC|mmetsp:Transcript_33242/g.88966  ORF Transcript_33242/g.88966 Transcript_33242/m.88966 type:complete len:209 (+) Transcript_33242:50-676(+)